MTLEKYVVTRVASRNPTINGLKLYLSSIFLWTLDVDHARRFDEAGAAVEVARNRDIDARSELAP